MPVISMFYGIMILMFYFDNKKHNLPHIHAQYAASMKRSLESMLGIYWKAACRSQK
jgi:hypothetical protein